jgi:hypothetical protein
MTQDECDSFNAFQHCGVTHPYTCLHHSQLEPLEARQDGLLHCLHCDYTQKTPHAWIDWSWQNMWGNGIMHGTLMDLSLGVYHERTGRPIGPKGERRET